MSQISEQEPSAVALEIMPRADGAERFQPLKLRLEDHITKSSAIIISADMTPEKQKEISLQAREARLKLFRALRIETGKLHDEAKRGILEIGNRLDSAEREIRKKCEAEEARLEEIETFQKRQEQKRREALHAERKATITPFLTGPVTGDLSGLSDEEFAAQLRDAQDGHAFREQRAEAQRVAREAAEAKRREEEEAAAEKRRQEAEAARVEHERVRREAEERRKEVERLNAETAAAQADARKAQADARKAQAELDRKAEEERKAREAEAQAERARRNAPDIEKVRAFRYELGQLELPALSAVNAATAAAIAEQRTKFKTWLNAVIEKMEGAK